MEDGLLGPVSESSLPQHLPPAPHSQPHASRALLSDLLALPELKQAALGAGFQVGW